MIKAANFIWSIYLLIMLDTLLLRPSLHFTHLHLTPLHYHVHLSTLHFLSFKLHPTTLHYPLIWLNSISISYSSISFDIQINCSWQTQKGNLIIDDRCHSTPLHLVRSCKENLKKKGKTICLGHCAKVWWESVTRDGQNEYWQVS